MSTYNMHFQDMRSRIIPNILISDLQLRGKQELKNEFEKSVVNEPSVFGPSKFRCILAVTALLLSKNNPFVKCKVTGVFDWGLYRISPVHCLVKKHGRCVFGGRRRDVEDWYSSKLQI